jgi:hypothetical protein
LKWKPACCRLVPHVASRPRSHFRRQCEQGSKAAGRQTPVQVFEDKLEQGSEAAGHQMSGNLMQHDSAHVGQKEWMGNLGYLYWSPWSPSDRSRHQAGHKESFPPNSPALEVLCDDSHINNKIHSNWHLNSFTGAIFLTRTVLPTSSVPPSPRPNSRLDFLWMQARR